MRNILNYYYGIIVDKIDNNGYFSYNNHLFCLYEYQRNIDDINALLLLNRYMLNNNIKINEIINNNYNEVLTYSEGRYYSLLLINYEYQNSYFRFIPSFINQRLDILKRNNWSILWSMKIDYVEYQIKHLSKKYPLLSESVYYYIGLSENAISYFKMLNLDNIPLYINHRRIKKNLMYNPLELVIDYKVRDISEYIKKSFFAREKTIYEIKKFINGINLNNIDYLLLYTRLLFPSYYFDIYDNIINGKIEEKEILKITNLVNEYEELLYEVYVLIKRKINILGIDWINQKFM